MQVKREALRVLKTKSSKKCRSIEDIGRRDIQEFITQQRKDGNIQLFCSNGVSKARNLLQNQVRICNRMKANILDHAQKTYFGVINGNEFLVKISCIFKELERASKKYNPNYNNKRGD